MAVRNCRGDAVIRLRNTALTLSSCDFANNDLVLHHSQIADDNCSRVSVKIQSCQFSNDVDSRPVYQPGVLLAGCDLIELTVSDSQFLTAPLMVGASLNTHVTMDNVLMRGVALRGSSLDITLGPGKTTDCRIRLQVTCPKGHLSEM